MSSDFWTDGQYTVGHPPHGSVPVSAVGQSHVRINGKKVVVKGDPIAAHGGKAAGSHHVRIGGLDIQADGDPISCGDSASAKNHVRIG